LSVAEAAEALGLSVSTAEKDWAYARSWLRLEMEGKGDSATAADFFQNSLRVCPADFA